MKRDKLERIRNIYKNARSLHARSAGLMFEFMKMEQRMRELRKRLRKPIYKYYVILID
jgi:hypothetical protein